MRATNTALFVSSGWASCWTWPSIAPFPPPSSPT